jgi:MFS family permease
MRHTLPSWLDLSALFSTFMLACVTWNFALGMTYILIPLYAHELGMSGLTIGSLVAIPMGLQIILNLFGGSWTDRIGGKRIAVFAAVAGVAAGLVFAVSSSFAGLLGAQLLWMISRAFFWPATWSLASQLAGNSARQFGLLNSVTSIGQLSGTAMSGMIVAMFGFRAGFWVFVAASVITMIGMMVYRAPAHVASRARPMLQTYVALLRRPSVYYAIMCAYISALPFSLSQSFYPILFVEQGFATDATGWILALRGIGQVVAGLIAGRILSQVAAVSMPLAAAVGMGVCVFFVAYVRDFTAVVLFVMGTGFGTGLMTLYFQVLISEMTSVAERGSAMAMGGLGWGISHLSTPLIMGYVKDHYGIQPAFYVVGVGVVIWGLAMIPVHRWAFHHGKPR